MKNKETDKKEYSFSGKTTNAYFNEDLAIIEDWGGLENFVFVTDENVFSKNLKRFKGKRTVTLKAGEEFKNQQTIDKIINKLIEWNVDRKGFLVGVGGGVVTDITGYAASVYMRGIRFGFAPTSILGMVDASMGGKNGVDVGVYKNLVGTINHPEFLIYDYSFLKTLPVAEWINGFAEIIKHACIRDREMFQILEGKSINDFQSSKELIGKLIHRNVDIKYDVVSKDEKESGDRRLLNFGHTFGHAIENTAKLPHGSAISIGMMLACRVSELINDFSKSETERIKNLLVKYQLPVAFDVDKEKTWNILLHDKKKIAGQMNFVVLDKIGKASVKEISLSDLQKLFYSI